MRAFASLLIFALSVTVVSCSGGGGSLPVVHDYTSAGPQVSAKPQSVIPPRQPCSGPTCGGGGGGGCLVAQTCVPLATQTEDPDDPDGPGHGPLPDLSLGVDNACPNGYALAYSNGDGGNPVGGAYCGVEIIPTAAQVASLYDVSNVIYQTSHYWNRHLACYVHNNYTSASWNENVIYPDFEPQVNNYPTTPGVAKDYVGANTVTENTGAQSQFGYHVALVSNVPVFPGVNYLTYSVGTSYLVPRRIDCPKPYPNYP
jgi:hypothetical protein